MQRAPARNRKVGLLLRLAGGEGGYEIRRSLSVDHCPQKKPYDAGTKAVTSISTLALTSTSPSMKCTARSCTVGAMRSTAPGANNGANWLLVPVLGPWLAIAARKDVCTYKVNGTTVVDPVDCTTDVLSVTGLVFDGIVQTAGATLLVIGFALPKKVLVRQDVAQITFRRIGSGYGIAAVGSF